VLSVPPTTKIRLRKVARSAASPVVAVARLVARLDRTVITYLVATLLAAGAGIGLTLAAKDQSPLQAIGESICGAAVVGVLFLLYEGLLAAEGEAKAGIRRAGVEAIYPERTGAVRDDHYRPLLRQALERLDILGTGLSSFRRDFPNGSEWWSGTPAVRILLADPTFPPTDRLAFMQRREVEEDPEVDPGQSGEAPPIFVRYLDAQFIRNRPQPWDEQPLKWALGADEDPTAWLRQTWSHPVGKGTLELRLTRCLPSITMMRIDDVTFWSPYLMQRESRQVPIMRVRHGSHLLEDAHAPFLARQVGAHFDLLWQRWSAPIPSDWRSS
jgi:hypothetical protein